MIVITRTRVKENMGSSSPLSGNYLKAKIQNQKRENRYRLEKISKNKANLLQIGKKLKPNLMVIRKVKFLDAFNDSGKKYRGGSNNGNNGESLERSIVINHKKLNIRNFSKSLDRTKHVREIEENIEMLEISPIENLNNLNNLQNLKNLQNSHTNYPNGVLTKQKLPPLNLSHVSNMDIYGKITPSGNSKGRGREHANNNGNDNSNSSVYNFAIKMDNSNLYNYATGNYKNNNNNNYASSGNGSSPKEYKIYNYAQKSQSPSPTKNRNNIALASNLNLKSFTQKSLSPEKKISNKYSKRLSINNNIYGGNNQSKCNYFIVKKGNNKELIKSILLMRLNWREAVGDFTTQFNYKWGNSRKGTDYGLFKSDKNKRLINHFESDFEVSNKKFMFLNFSEYCEKQKLNVFDYVPFTIVIKINGVNYKENYKSFNELFFLNNNIKNIISEDSSKITQAIDYSEAFKSDNMNYKTSMNNIYIPKTHFTGRNLWLVKPTDLYGGKCIQISESVEEIEKIIKKFHEGIEKQTTKEEESDSESESSDENIPVPNNYNKSPTTVKRRYRASTVIIQKYIENPLLYYGRKFDIRMWVLIDHKMDVFVFKEGHLKTTSIEYTTESKDKFVHITNYSLQKHNNNFEKYEIGNEVSFKEFQTCMDSSVNEEYRNIDVRKKMMPQMIEIIKLTTLSVKDKLNKKSRKFCYVVLGYDFMIDVNFKVWLIEINKNPGLVESSPVIKQLVPRMIDDSLKITLDPIFDNKFVGESLPVYPVEDYVDEENMFEFVHSLNNSIT